MHARGIAGPWLGAMVGVAAFLATQPVWAEPPKPAPAAVPIVKAWGELRRAPAVEVWTGLSVRLGMEAAECPVGHGVFLYCLTDRYGPPGRWSEEDRLGPLNVTLTDADGKRLDFWKTGFGLEAHQKVPAGLAKSELLYLRRVVAPRAGVVRVQLEARPGGGDPRVVATAEVKVGATGHPFDRFEVVGPEPKAGQTAFRVRNKGGDRPCRAGRNSAQSSATGPWMGRKSGGPPTSRSPG